MKKQADILTQYAEIDEAHVDALLQEELRKKPFSGNAVRHLPGKCGRGRNPESRGGSAFRGKIKSNIC